MTDADRTAQTTPDGLQLSGEGLAAMAMLGKAAAALVVVIVVILALAWLVRRFNLHQGPAGQHLQVVASAAVGQRERVVIVEVEDSWLVLGVAQNQVTLLDKRPIPEDRHRSPATSGNADPTFASRLARAFQRSPSGASSRPGQGDDQR